MSNRNNKTEVKSQPKKASKKPANAPVSPQKAQKGKNFKSTKTAPQRQQRANTPISQTATKKASASSSPNKTANNSKKRKEEIRKIEPSYDQLIPIIRMVDEGQTGFMLKNGKYMNVYQIIGQDYEGMMENAVRLQAAQTERFFITLEGNTPKIVNLSLPLDTRRNQAYRERMKAKNQNPEYRRINEEAIRELQELGNRQCKQSYLEIYAESYEKLQDYNRKVISTLCAEGLAKIITPREKVRYLQKKNNPHNYGYR